MWVYCWTCIILWPTASPGFPHRQGSVLRKHRFPVRPGECREGWGGGACVQQGRRMTGVDQQWGMLEGLRACHWAGSVGTVVWVSLGGIVSCVCPLACVHVCLTCVCLHWRVLISQGSLWSSGLRTVLGIRSLFSGLSSLVWRWECGSSAAACRRQKSGSCVSSSLSLSFTISLRFP